MAKCKVITVTNQKGGVGKTTTTVNLGVKDTDKLDTTISNLMQVVVDNGIILPPDNGILKGY